MTDDFHFKVGSVKHIDKFTNNIDQTCFIEFN